MSTSKAVSLSSLPAGRNISQKSLTCSFSISRKCAFILIVLVSLLYRSKIVVYKNKIQSKNNMFSWARACSSQLSMAGQSINMKQLMGFMTPFVHKRSSELHFDNNRSAPLFFSTVCLLSSSGLFPLSCTLSCDSLSLSLCLARIHRHATRGRLPCLLVSSF